MKYILIAVVTAGLFSACANRKAQVQQPNYTVIQNGSTKILNGYINRALIEKDSAFPWFSENIKGGQADPAAVSAFASKKDKFSMIVFGGTWCGDTKQLLPVFYRLVDKSGYPDNKITLIGVDRSKHTIEDLHTKWSITNVPTFIVIANGKEVGRVVEYGKLGEIDKELGQIVAAIQ
jgi:thiol-disulfide isomerase/thioredoxin